MKNNVLGKDGNTLKLEEGLPDDNEKVFQMNLQRMDSEVQPMASRRYFKNGYKLKILDMIDNCQTKGEVGALLRREGLYSSTVSGWRKQRAQGKLGDTGDGQPMPEAAVRKIRELERENKKLRKKLACAEVALEIQKKISEMLNLDSE